MNIFLLSLFGVLAGPVGATMVIFSLDEVPGRRLVLGLGGLGFIVIGWLMILAATRGG